MKFPKEIRQYLWSNFQTKEKTRDLLFEERCQQKQMCDKLMNNDYTGGDTSEFALMNNYGKIKIVKTLKSKDYPRHSMDDAEAWSRYIDKIKTETKMKNIKKLLNKKSKKLRYIVLVWNFINVKILYRNQHL